MNLTETIEETISTIKRDSSIFIKIPDSIKIFENKTITIKRNIEGFIIRTAGIDDRRSVIFNNKNGRKVYLTTNNTKATDRYNDIEGEYYYEIIDNDTLKLIKI